MSSLLTVIGLIFTLFLPGYFLTLIFFREVKALERIVLSITFSIMIAVFIGIFLGYNEDVKNFTGGINKFNVWLWELIVTFVLGLIALIINRKQVNLRRMSSLRHEFKSLTTKHFKKKNNVEHKE